MKWFKRRKPDPFADLKREPTVEERAAFAIERLAQDKLDALRDGVHRASGLTNVAPGTRGYTLHLLVYEGLMTCERDWTHPEAKFVGGFYIYRPTAKGLALIRENRD